MLEFRCADVGAVCRRVVRARTREDLLRELARHAAEEHGVARLNQTLINYALKKVRGSVEREEVSGG